MSKVSIFPIFSYSSLRYQSGSGTGVKASKILIEALLVELDLGFYITLCPEEGDIFPVL